MCSILRKSWTSFFGRLSTIECLTPSIPDIPIFEDQCEELSFDGRYDKEVLEVVLAAIEWRFIDVWTTGHISDAKSGAVPKVIDRVNTLPGHVAS
jgi:hypothetical protein